MPSLLRSMHPSCCLGLGVTLFRLIGALHVFIKSSPWTHFGLKTKSRATWKHGTWPGCAFVGRQTWKTQSPLHAERRTQLKNLVTSSRRGAPLFANGRVASAENLRLGQLDWVTRTPEPSRKHCPGQAWFRIATCSFGPCPRVSCNSCWADTRCYGQPSLCLVSE